MWIPIAFGKLNRSESAAAILAVAACENPKAVYTDVTLAILKDLPKGGFLFVYDDPSNTTFLRTLLIDAFGGAEMGTRHNQFSARCHKILHVGNIVNLRIPVISQICKSVSYHTMCTCNIT